jgi:transposase
MWTEQSRGRMAKIAKKTKRHPSDLTDDEWEQFAPLMPKPGRRGRPREVDFREVVNAVRYLVRSGCGWRMLPIHFGAWQTVYGWFRELARRFLFQTIHDVALMLDRERAGREASPTAGVIDSQSVKARRHDEHDQINVCDEWVPPAVKRAGQNPSVFPNSWRIRLMRSSGGRLVV